MKRSIPALTFATCLITAVPVLSFQRETTNDPSCNEAPGVNCPHLGTPLVWKRLPARYFVNSDASGSSFDTVLGPIEAAFSSWQNAGSGNITFELAGPSHNGSNGQDGQNTISWQNLSNASDVFAQSIVTYDTHSGEIFDVDIELNDNFQFGVLPTGENDPNDPTVDIQATLTHEAGHLLGLDHENRFGPQEVMYFEDTTGDTTHRNLTADDQAGVRAIYPPHASSGGGGCAIAPSGPPAGLWPLSVLLVGLALRRRRSKLPLRETLEDVNHPCVEILRSLTGIQ